MDLFASNTSTHEAYIRATLEAKSNYCLFSRSEQVGRPNDPDTWHSVDAPMHILSGGHIVPGSHGVLHNDKGRRSWHQPRSIKITAPMPVLYFGHKRVLVGKWHFVELSEVEMRHWVETKWRPLLGYMPTKVQLLNN